MMLANFSLEGVKAYLLDVLGDDPPELRPEKYLEALNGIGIDGLRNIISRLLNEDIRPETVENSYFHPNKFFKLGICRLSNKVKLRLHFWNKDQLEVQTPIHFHAWDFASMLVTGSYLHDIFKVADLDSQEVNLIENYRQKLIEDIPEHYFGMYKIPKRDGALGKFSPKLAKYVKVEKTISKIEKQGSIYFLGMQYPHQITINLKEVGSMITLVLTSETHPENVFTFQPVTQTKSFDNPSPGVDAKMVKKQLEIILKEINHREFNQA